jgi:very-short-patch-repair endonuclease
MDVHEALRRVGGAAKTDTLRRFGVGRGAVERSMRAGSVIRVRKGWFALASISPIERRALIDHGFLTCAAAARLRGLPAKEANHYHLRSNRPVVGERSGRRRRPFTSSGALVSFIDMVEDYVHCQPPEWSLALLDALERNRLMTTREFEALESRLPAKLRDLAQRRSAVPESPLESVVRYRLEKSRIPFVMQERIGSFRVDFLIGHGVVLETHGAEFHANREAWERDRVRTLWLRDSGYEVIEMTFSQLDDWPRVVSVIQRARRIKLTQ